MESDSKKRGRPKVFSDRSLRAATVGSGEKTHRQQQNRVYALLALHDIRQNYSGNNQTGWLISEKTIKWGILTELGRIRVDTPKKFWTAVEWTLKTRPKVKDAIVVLRRYRTEKASSGDSLGLANEISNLIGNYRMRHPNITPAVVREALVLAEQRIQD